MPVWSPDGSRTAFGAERQGSWGLYLKRADNTQDEELLLAADAPVMPMSWSPDGSTLVYWTRGARTQGDVWRVADRRRRKRFGVPKGNFTLYHAWDGGSSSRLAQTPESS